MNDVLIDELRGVLSGVVGKDTDAIQPGDDLVEALGIDSLTGLRYLAVIEKKYNIRFPDHELAGIRSLEKVCSYIETTPESEAT